MPLTQEDIQELIVREAVERATGQAKMTTAQRNYIRAHNAQAAARAGRGVADYRDPLRERILPATAGMGGLNDFVNPLKDRIMPATAGVGPKGPLEYPAKVEPQTVSTEELLKAILRAILDQSTPLIPHVRGNTATTSGVTLDWSTIGLMTRLFIRNKGAQSVFIQFDTEGTNVNTTAGVDYSFEVQANESLNINNIAFTKIGMKTSGATGVVNAIGFRGPLGNWG